jgi:hypothetical protein
MPPEVRRIAARPRPQSPEYVKYWGSLRPCLATTGGTPATGPFRQALLDAHRFEVELASGDAHLRGCDLREDALDVDLAVRGRIRTEPARRLRELTLAAPRIPAAGVKPGYGDVDEPLEEVALLRRRLAPLVLELLVGLEVGAVADQLEAALEGHVSVTID